MVLDGKRSLVDPLLTGLATKLDFASANFFSWLAFLFAIIAGFLFYFSDPNNAVTWTYLPLASLFIFSNGLFDAIDGKIAKLTNTSSKQGDFLDHALDRYADVFIVGGLGLSPWCDMRIGFFALIGMLLTSYMGTQAQAVGYRRVYGGILGRADRLVLLMIAPVIHFLLINNNAVLIWGYNVLEWVLIIIAIVGNITAAQRFYQTLAWFKKKK